VLLSWAFSTLLTVLSKFDFRNEISARCALAPAVALLFILFAVSPVLGAEQENSAERLARIVSAGGTLTTADFDGDSRRDRVFAFPEGSSFSSTYIVTVRLSTQIASASFTVQSIPGGLQLAAQDVDGDCDLDLVITTRFFGEHVGVWVNDGSGNLTKTNAADYPLWIWGAGPRLEGSSPAEKTSPAMLAPGTPFVLCTLICSPVSPVLASIGYPELRRTVTPFFGSHRIRPPPQYL
jgi:hypothetical protein